MFGGMGLCYGNGTETAKWMSSQDSKSVAGGPGGNLIIPLTQEVKSVSIECK